MRLLQDFTGKTGLQIIFMYSIWEKNAKTKETTRAVLVVNVYQPQ